MFGRFYVSKKKQIMLKRLRPTYQKLILAAKNRENCKHDINRLPVIFTVKHLVGEEFLKK